MSPGAGVGVDLLEIARLERAVERRPGLSRRLFSEDELAACSARRRPARHLAARFCAKEAAIKALGMKAASLSDFEVLGGRDEPVTMRLTGRAAQRADQLGCEVLISLTHDRERAMAIAMLVEG